MVGKRILQLPFLFVLLLVVLFLCTHAPYFGNNAPTYIKFNIIRQPLYPIFIWLFHWGGKYQFYLVMWVQSIITFFSLLYARHWLKKNLYLSDVTIFPVILLVLITISFHYQMHSIDDPEGLSFPFFIFTFFNTIECFQKKSFKKNISLAVWVSALILLRTQFYFYYGVYIVLIVWYFWKMMPKKYILKVTSVFILSIVLTNVVDRGYHYYMNGVFSTEPFSGLVTIIQPLYLANPDAAKYFTNHKEKAIVQTLLDEIKIKKLNRDVSALASSKVRYYEYAHQEYERNYLPIQSIVSKTFTGIPLKDIYKINTNALIKMNKMTLSISKTLFLHNIKINSYFYIYKIIAALGGIPYFLFFCLLSFIALIKLFRNRRFDLKVSEVFVFLVLLVTFFNAMIVAVAEPNCVRYYCYTQFLLYCFGAYIAELIYMNRNKAYP